MKADANLADAGSIPKSLAYCSTMLEIDKSSKPATMSQFEDCRFLPHAQIAWMKADANLASADSFPESLALWPRHIPSYVSSARGAKLLPRAPTPAILLDGPEGASAESANCWQHS